MTTRRLCSVLLPIVVAAGAAVADVSLTTPATQREVHIRLDRAPKALVQELRTVPLVPGHNTVTVSWQDAKVDRLSCRFVPVRDTRAVRIGPLTLPAGQDKAVQWSFRLAAGAEPKADAFWLCYLLDGLVWRVQYLLRLGEGGITGDLAGDAIVHNDSGQDFERAKVSLGAGREAEVRMAHGETVTVPYVRATNVPVQQLLVYDEALYGDALGVHYLVANHAASGLGQHPLASGKLRVYRGEGVDEILVGEGVMPYLPPGETGEFLVAFAQDVKVTKRQLSSERVNVRRDDNRQVMLFDLEEAYEVEIVSEREEAARVKFVEHVDGDWDVMKADREHAQPDATSLVFELTVGAGQTVKLSYKVKRRNLTP
ncbi:MAG: hypothetical protein ACE5R4_07790 [Armatimonadota bacterium]